MLALRGVPRPRGLALRPPARRPQPRRRPNAAQPLAFVEDAPCAAQQDAVTCGLHAARNAALLRAGQETGSDAATDGASVAADLDGLARIVELRRRDACACVACRDRRATRRWAGVVTALATRLAAPQPHDPLLRAALASPRAREEDADLELPLWLPLPRAPSDIKAALRTRARTSASLERGGADAALQRVAPAPPSGDAVHAEAGAAAVAFDDAGSDGGPPNESSDAGSSETEGSRSTDEDDASDDGWQVPAKRRRVARSNAEPLKTSNDVRNPLRVKRGRYAVLVAARSKASAADKQLAAARATAEEARLQASMAAAAAVTHNAGATACDEAPATPVQDQLQRRTTTATPPAESSCSKRPLTFPPLQKNDLGPSKRPALSTPSPLLGVPTRDHPARVAAGARRGARA